MTDLTDGMFQVVNEPIQIGEFSSIEKWRVVKHVDPESEYYMDIPFFNDDYTYTFDSVMIIHKKYTDYRAYGSPDFGGLYFFYSYYNIVRHFFARFWIDHSLTLVPIKSHALSLSFPSGVGAYVKNSSKLRTTVRIQVNVIKKLKMEV